MRKLVCPQCKVPSLYVKDEHGNRRMVYVMEDGSVVARKPDESTDGFDLTIVYCLGCSWSGSPKRLIKG